MPIVLREVEGTTKLTFKVIGHAFIKGVGNRGHVLSSSGQPNEDIKDIYLEAKRKGNSKYDIDTLKMLGSHYAMPVTLV